MKWETVSQSQFLMFFKAHGIIIRSAVSEETKHKFVFEPCFNFPKGWINPTAIYPEIQLIFIVVNCNKLILLRQYYMTAVDPKTEKQVVFSVPIVLVIFTVQDVVRH